MVAYLIAKYAGRYVERFMTKRSIGSNGALLIGKLSMLAVWIVWISWVLSSLGANTTGLVTFFSASTVAVTLSLQDIMRNFVAGIVLLIERPFSVGDRIKVRDVVGEVQGVDIRTTLIRNS
ncbi:MAG: mechanosensitive ion channel domain-containing protein, partial [Thermomicrobiales bacterium]